LNCAENGVFCLHVQIINSRKARLIAKGWIDDWPVISRTVSFVMVRKSLICIEYGI
jgi:hypothetical protein